MLYCPIYKSKPTVRVCVRVYEQPIRKEGTENRPTIITTTYPIYKCISLDPSAPQKG